MSQKLLLDRVEFPKIKVESAQGAFDKHSFFPQLEIDSTDVAFLVRSQLIYSPDEIDDPRAFMLSYGVKVENGKDKPKVPYEIEVEACAYFRYVGGDEFIGADRFRAVRFSGYQILYGAIREMVSNLTARGTHGMWVLPARNFGMSAKTKADEDEVERQKALAARAALSAPQATAALEHVPDAAKSEGND